MNRVNSAIGIIFAVALVVGFFMKLIDSQAFLAVAGVCIGFFFPKPETTPAATRTQPSAPTGT
jgi:uncharacterized membrane protein